MTSPMVYAALLLHKAGQPITVESVSKVLKASGLSPNEAAIENLVNVLKEVNIDDALATAPIQSQPPAPPPSGAAEVVEKPQEEQQDEVAEGLTKLFG